MPLRYLKPEICDSETLDLLSPLAEVLFYRLLVTVDDFGRFDSRAALVKSKCFPVRDTVTAQDVDTMLEELHKKQVISLYEVDGRRYLQMSKWTNIPRAKVSKFPEMSAACKHLYTDVNICPQAHTNAPYTDTDTDTLAHPPDDASDENSLFEKFWEAYPKKKSKGDAIKVWRKIKAPVETLRKILAALAWQSKSEEWIKQGGQFIPYPATYLNARGWLDESQRSTTGGFSMDEFLRNK